VHDLGEQLRQGWDCPSVRYGCARLIRCTQHPVLLSAAFRRCCACSIGGAHRDLQLHCHQAHLFTAPARTVTPRGLRVKPGWPKQTTCFWLAKTTRRSRERQIRVVVYHGCQVVLASCYAST